MPLSSVSSGGGEVGSRDGTINEQTRKEGPPKIPGKKKVF